jgi:hypothetical protein
MLGWRPASLTRLHGEGRGEQDINPITAAILIPYGRQVFGGHHVAYPDTLAHLRNFNLKPMICVRNLYDTIISCKERLDEHGANTVLPPTHVPFDWEAWDEESKQEWVAYNVGAWQIKFFVSWVDANIDKLWVRYDAFFVDQQAGWKRILDYYELPHPTSDVFDWAMGAKNNFNVGTQGRGNKLLFAKTKRILDSQVASWGKTREATIKAWLY